MLFSNLDSFFELNQDVRYLFLSRFLGCQIICLLSYFIEIVAIFMRKKKIKPFYRIGIKQCFEFTCSCCYKPGIVAEQLKSPVPKALLCCSANLS